MSDRVLILGGTGVFGGHLADMLTAKGVEVLRAGRRGPVVLDRDDEGLAAAIRELAPRIVIDAAGPFQSYGDAPYRVARAALAAGADYLDLSDDAGFCAGIVTLDAEARAQGRVILSGVSSVPALSSAVADHLAKGLQVDAIHTAILPGNRAPRGLSVVRAILAQVGQPLLVMQGGVWRSMAAWSRPERLERKIGQTRLLRRASLIGAPDLALFPDRYHARTVEFRAGLELSILDRGLAALGWLVRLSLVKSLAPLAPALRRIAVWFTPFGSDTGGMMVRLRGTGPDGAVERQWTMIVNGADGPKIPAIPGQIVTQMLLAGQIAPGARPALGEFTLAAAERALHALNLETLCETRAFTPVFETALGAAFADLPAPLADLHHVLSTRIWQGQADITRGQGLLARLAARLVGFPPAATDIPVTVTMERRGAREIWTRQFGRHRFRSIITPRAVGQGMVERFGPLSFDIALRVDNQRLLYPVIAGRCLGVPLPSWLLPRSETHESVDHLGRASFDVALSHPLTGLIVRYRGWLVDGSHSRPAALSQS